VHAHPEVGGQPDDGIQRLVAQREARVGADQAAAAGAEEPLVLGQPGLGALWPVAVGDLVGAQHPHPDLGAGGGDHVEAAVDRRRRGVVIDDGGGARLERLDRAQQRRPPDRLGVEGHVEPPPDPLEDLGEVGRRDGGRRHAPGKRGVEVMVGADEPGRGGGHEASS
jgi:hypothetical protein